VSAARGQGGGLAGEEDIKVFQIAVEDLFDQLAAGTIEDPKLAIAGYWLKYNIEPLVRRAEIPDRFSRGRYGVNDAST